MGQGSIITPKEIEEGMMMAILAYVLFLIPLLVARGQRFAMYHTQQAILLVILGIWIYSLVNLLLPAFFGPILWLGLFILWLLGLYNATQGKVNPLPLLGQFGEKFNLVK